MPQEETKLRDGRIVRSESPLNLEMPFSTLDSFITPTKSFYVRTHFPIPAIDRDAWWLHVEGEVEKAVRHKLRTAHDIRVSHGSGDFGMRREQPKFPRAESKGRAMAPRCGKHRGVDRRATFDLARSSESQTKCVRSDSGRSRLRHA